MGKITAQAVLDMGFTKEVFDYSTDDSFKQYIEDVIEEQGALLRAELGSSLYDATTEPNKTYVKYAEKMAVAGVLAERRLNRKISQVVSGGTPDDMQLLVRQAGHYRRARSKYVFKILYADVDMESLGVSM